MAIRKLKPVTPTQRFRTVADFSEITRSEPEKSLLEPLKKTGGRNHHGKVTAWHRGGGHKRRYRIIDFKRDKDGIVGRVDLAQELYEQAAVVSANVGNTLPLVGAVVGGPPGAAAMLIFSQIFKKPLQEATQVYYGIGGTFDEPDIQSITPEVFALSGAMAGCVVEDDS